MTSEQELLGPYYEGFQKGYTEGLGVAAKVSNAFTLDVASGNVFDLTLTANSTVSMLGRASTGLCYSFVAIVRLTGGPWTLTGPASWKYAGGSAPTYSAGSVNMITGLTVDGGTTYYVSAAGFTYS